MLASLISMASSIGSHLLAEVCSHLFLQRLSVPASLYSVLAHVCIDNHIRIIYVKVQQLLTSAQACQRHLEAHPKIQQRN
jgi:hypothetical protein